MRLTERSRKSILRKLNNLKPGRYLVIDMHGKLQDRAKRILPGCIAYADAQCLLDRKAMIGRICNSEGQTTLRLRRSLTCIIIWAQLFPDYYTLGDGSGGVSVTVTKRDVDGLDFREKHGLTKRQFRTKHWQTLFALEYGR